MKKIILTFMLFFIMAGVVRAEEFKLSLNAEDKIVKTVVVDLVIDKVEEKDKYFYGVMGVLEFPDDLELTSIKGLNDFNLTYNNQAKKIVLYRNTGVNEKIGLIRMTFNNKNNLKEGKALIKLKDIKVSDLSKDIALADISKEISYAGSGEEATNTNTYLDKITINGKELDFKQDELNYEIVVSNDTEEIKLDAISQDNAVTVTGTGNHELNVGSNEFDITVLGSDGSTRTYTVTVNREGANANNNDESLFIKSSDNEKGFIKYIPYIGGGILIIGIIFLFVRKRFINNKKEGVENEKEN